MMVVANSGLTQGLEAFGEQTTQSLYYLSQFASYAAQQRAQCEPVR